jgi:DNA-binding NarL/FixJ family response regulator
MPTAPTAAKRRVKVRRQSIDAAVRMTGSAARTPVESLHLQRRMLAGVCRMIGDQINGGATTQRCEARRQDGPDPAVLGVLSPRMRQTLERLVAGDSEKEVATRLGVSPHTVHVYVKSLYRRLSVSSRGELFAVVAGRRAVPSIPRPGDARATARRG